MEFTIALESPFNLDYTLESGQVFRWEDRGEWWYGVIAGGVMKAKQEGDSLTCVTSSDLLDRAFVQGYFRLGDDLESVMASITKDDILRQAVQRFYGLRLIAQERWECLASFLLATNSNIPRIKKMVAAVSSKYGVPLEFQGGHYFAFPKPEVLADATVADLQSCGLGYRARFLKHVSKSVAEDKVDFSQLSFMDYEEARRELLKDLFGEKLLLGVGPKVADCVLLYSLGKDTAFPIDTWIAKALADSYPHLLEKKLAKKLAKDEGMKLTGAEYARVSSAVRTYFGGFAGYAQQYLYMSSRVNG